MKWNKTSEKLPKDGESVWVMDVDEKGDIIDEPRPATFCDDENPAWHMLTHEYETHGDLLWLDSYDLTAWTRWRHRYDRD